MTDDTVKVILYGVFLYATYKIYKEWLEKQEMTQAKWNQEFRDIISANYPEKVKDATDAK